MAAADKTGRVGPSAWLATLMDALLGLIALLLILIHPPKPDDDSKPPGQIVVEIRWPDLCNSDVDLWVLGPEDQPVGYSNTQGKVFNLLRDDLGARNDLANLNYENAYSRGTPDGEYVINVHFYAHAAAPGCDTPIQVVWRVSKRGATVASELANGSVALHQTGQEITLVQFTMKDGAAVDLSRVQRKIRVDAAWP